MAQQKILGLFKKLYMTIRLHDFTILHFQNLLYKFCLVNTKIVLFYNNFKIFNFNNFIQLYLDRY